MQTDAEFKIEVDLIRELYSAMPLPTARVARDYPAMTFIKTVEGPSGYVVGYTECEGCGAHLIISVNDPPIPPDEPGFQGCEVPPAAIKHSSQPVPHCEKGERLLAVMNDVVDQRIAREC